MIVPFLAMTTKQAEVGDAPLNCLTFHDEDVATLRCRICFQTDKSKMATAFFYCSRNSSTN